MLNFPKYDITSKHIENILLDYSKHTNRNIEEVRFEVLDKVNNEKLKLNKQSPIVYKEVIDLLIEEVVFEEYLISKNLINKQIIYSLVNDIKIRHKQFMPLMDGYTYQKIFQVNLIFIPNKVLKLNPEFENVKTAAITPQGDLIFNINFINKLLTWAQYKKTNGKTLWYDIPEKDMYTYIEFLILHEYLHILNGDLYYSSNEDFDIKFNNLVCDFINNYELLKYFGNIEDYLLPIGLWSNKYNFDNFKTKDQIFDTIKKELINNYKHNFDEHFNNETRIENNDIRNFKLEEFSDIDEIEYIENNIEDIKIEEHTNNDYSNNISIIENLEYNPKYNWKKILNKFIPHNNENIVYSYSKINKRSISSIDRLETEGISSIKPGIIKNNDDKKDLLLIIDNSGSTISSLNSISYEFLELLKNKENNLNNLFVLKFDSSFKLYKLDLINNKYIEFVEPCCFLQHFNYKSKIKYNNIRELFLQSSGGGTIFCEQTKDVAFNIIKKYKTNTIFFTDNDILYHKNKNHLENLFKSCENLKIKFSLIATNEETKLNIQNKTKYNQKILFSNF